MFPKHYAIIEDMSGKYIADSSVFFAQFGIIYCLHYMCVCHQCVCARSKVHPFSCKYYRNVGDIDRVYIECMTV